MTGWTVYDHPRDFPDCFVARKWITVKGAAEPRPTGEIMTAPTLDRLREQLPPGLCMFPRNENDDPVIVEVWL